MAGIKGKQIATGSDGVDTANLVDGLLSADASGRAKIATGFFNSAKVTDAFASGSVALSRLAEAVIQADGGQAFTANQSLGGFKLTNVGAPTANNDVARKSEVDAIAAGLAWKEEVKAATTQDLTAESFGSSGVTYANGASGVGATLTQDVATDGAFGSIDGISIGVGNRLLVKDQTAGEENGIYELTTAGDGSSTPWVLTRVTDADESSELNVAAVLIAQGTVNADHQYTQTANSPTIGTTALTWQRFGGLAQVTAGAGLDKATDTLFIGDVDRGVQVNADDLEIDASEVASSAGGLVQNGTNTWQLDVNPDSTTGGDTAPVTVGANGVGVDVTTLDGDHLDIDFTPANYTPDAGPTEAADADDLAAHLKGIDDALVTAGAVPTTNDKDLSPAATSGDESSTTLTISTTPTNNGYVRVTVNGIGYVLGDGVKTKDCFFSADGGTTARAISAIASGDTLYWNGVVVGFDLAASDVVEFQYDA